MSDGVRSLQCEWCGRPFSVRETGGRRQRFCCPAHREAMWVSYRLYGQRQYEAGHISLAELRRIVETQCTLDPAPPAERLVKAGDADG